MNRPALAIAALFGFAPAFPASAGAPAKEALKSAQMEYMRGTMLERRGEGAAALEAYLKALSFDPQSAFIYREASELALELGHNDRAQALAARALEIDPRSAQAHLLMGRVLWAQGEAALAEKSFSEALRLDPRSAESIFSLAVLLAARSPDKARGLLLRFIEQNPASAAKAHLELAKLEMDAGRAAQAEVHFMKSVELDTDLEALPARYALASAYESRGSTAAALGQYLEILKLEPRNVALLGHVGRLYFLKGDLEEARARFEAAKSLDASDPAANHWLALFAEKEGDFDKAAGLLAASSALGRDPALSVRLSFYHSQAGRLKEAVAALESAHARWPENDQIAYFLARGYEDFKRQDKAAALLKRVVELKPDYREARYQLGVLLERAGRMGEAEAQFRALLARSPDDASALNYLGYSLADRGLKLDEAEALIRQALRLEPENGAYRDSLGWVHFKQGRSTQAITELLSALEVLPEDDTVWDHLGEAYAAAGRPPSAWFAYMRSRLFAQSGARGRRKADSLRSRFSAEELGGYYLDYLRSAQGGLRRLSGLCEVRGNILGRPFAYNGIMTFKAPQELSVDILGPLFTPMLRLRVNEEGFVMDPVRIEGVKPEAVMEAAHATFSSLRDYLSGSLYALRPARYKKRWRSRAIELPGWTLGLDSDGTLARTLKPQAYGGVRLDLEDFEAVKGRRVPKTVKASGEGYSLVLRCGSLNVETTAAAPGPSSAKSVP